MIIRNTPRVLGMLENVVVLLSKDLQLPERLEHVPINIKTIYSDAANAILKDPGKLLTCTIIEYAEFINTSPATITRFCKRMNISGFQELKLLIAKAINNDDLIIGSIDRDINSTSIETTSGIIASVMTNAISSLDRLNRLLDVGL